MPKVGHKFEKYQCKFCKKDYSYTILHRHEIVCRLNPKNKHLWRKCPTCKEKFFPTKEAQVTCSTSCSNTHFRSAENHGNYKKNASYRITCWRYHEKKCVVCGEKHVVEVHHYDCDGKNNNPRNFIPLCPTHHQYMHSRFKALIIDKVKAYHKWFKEKWKNQKLS